VRSGRGHRPIDYARADRQDGHMKKHGGSAAECANNQGQRKNAMTLGRHESQKRAQQGQISCARSLPK